MPGDDARGGHEQRATCHVPPPGGLQVAAPPDERTWVRLLVTNYRQVPRTSAVRVVGETGFTRRVALAIGLFCDVDCTLRHRVLL